MHPFVFWAKSVSSPSPFTVKAQIKQSDQTAFEALAAHYVDQWPALSPVNATSLGDHRFDHQMDDVSAEANSTLLFLKEQRKRSFPSTEIASQRFTSRLRSASTRARRAYGASKSSGNWEPLSLPA